MASKTRKRAKNRAAAKVAPELFVPKAGPGQVFTKIGDDDGNPGRRLQNVGASPLLLALHRGQLESTTSRITARDRFECGEIFEKAWSILHSSGGRDSTNPGIGGGYSSGGFTDAQQRSGEGIHRWSKRMGQANFRIVQAFCGDGHSMAESLRQAGIEAHPVGTAFRIREALDDLVYALTGMRGDVQSQQVAPVENRRKGN